MLRLSGLRHLGLLVLFVPCLPAGCLGSPPDEAISTGQQDGGGASGSAGGGIGGNGGNLAGGSAGSGASAGTGGAGASGAGAGGGASGASAGAAGGDGCKVGSTLDCAEDETGKALTFPGGVPKGECKKGQKTCENVNGVTKYSACKGAVGPAKRDCASPKDNDCDGAPDSQVDSTCQCLPTDDTSCTGPAPGNCKGTRECGYLGSSSKWGGCNAPADCSCTVDQACKVGQCSGTQKCTAGKLGKCTGGGPSPVELLPTCECDPGLGGKSCQAIGGAKSCGTAACGSSQKYDLAACSVPTTCYVDADKDGAGAGYKSVMSACAACPAGYASNASDCDDAHTDVQFDGQACDTNQGSLGICSGKILCAGGADSNASCKPNGCTSNSTCTLCGGSESGTRTCQAQCIPSECTGTVGRPYAGAMFDQQHECPGTGTGPGAPNTWLSVSAATPGCKVGSVGVSIPKGTLNMTLGINTGSSSATAIQWGVYGSGSALPGCDWTDSFTGQKSIQHSCYVPTACSTYSLYVIYISGDNSFSFDNFTITGTGSQP